MIVFCEFVDKELYLGALMSIKVWLLYIYKISQHMIVVSYLGTFRI